MTELEGQIADILAQYWLKENPYCGLPTREIYSRLTRQIDKPPKLARVSKAISELSKNGAVSTREAQNDVWVYHKQ